MSFANWISNVNFWVANIAVVGISILVAIVLIEIRNRIKIKSGFPDVLNALGIIYGVLVTLTIVFAWQIWITAEQDIVREVTSMNEVKRYIESNFPNSPPQIISDAIASIEAYYDSVVNDEWNYLANVSNNGTSDPKTLALLNQVWASIFAINVVTEQDQMLYQSILTKMQDHSQFRDNRISNSRPKIPNAFWAILIFIGIITIAYSVFLEPRESRFSEIVSISLMAFVIIISWIITLYLERPFSGVVRISSDLYVQTRKINATAKI